MIVSNQSSSWPAIQCCRLLSYLCDLFPVDSFRVIYSQECLGYGLGVSDVRLQVKRNQTYLPLYQTMYNKSTLNMSTWKDFQYLLLLPSTNNVIGSKREFLTILNQGKSSFGKLLWEVYREEMRHSKEELLFIITTRYFQIPYIPNKDRHWHVFYIKPQHYYVWSITQEICGREVGCVYI